ncbi:16S rRNA (guanine(966)-N(2))-methyltransferase RsmD [Salinicoccus sp. HZC-1]|uniref:16S rRNA (guanine(966)-N(2))-methyltransferase RsmD n=1 Tax=Salinicoccus sp. HZC-1 TaxID=3385497 RepID=UPI00398AEC5E
MRIISGKYKSRKIETLNSNDTRPTTDKVRENIFNILGMIEGDVLDLFAGSGALGLEALSRGADSAMFIDGARDATGIIRKNTKGVEERVEIFKNDYRRALKALAKREKSFDLIFLDPPYHKDIVPAALVIIDELGILKENGRIVAETHKDEVYQSVPYESIKEAVYGTIKVNVLVKEG